MSPHPAPAPRLLPAHRIRSPELRTRSSGSGRWASPFCLALAGGTGQLPPASTRYSLFAALSGLMREGLAPHLPQITTLMLLSLRSTEGIVVSRAGGLGDWGKGSPGVAFVSWMWLSRVPAAPPLPSLSTTEAAPSFCLTTRAAGRKRRSSWTRTRKRRMTPRSQGAEECRSSQGNPGFGRGPHAGPAPPGAGSLPPPPCYRYSVENAFFDEKEDACAALGEISVNAR